MQTNEQNMFKQKLAAMQQHEFGVVYNLASSGKGPEYIKEGLKDQTLQSVETKAELNITLKEHFLIPVKISLVTDANGFKFVHVRINNIVDNTLPDAAVLQQMLPQIQEKIDEITRGLQEDDRLRNDAKKAVFHCNGGLGRGPSFMVAYKLNEAVKYAKENKLEIVANWDKQSELIVDGKLNLAAVYRNLMIRGTYARSTFVQSVDQFKALYELVNSLVLQNTQQK